MTIAFTTRTPETDAAMDPRFGRTRWLQLLDEETGVITTVDNSDADAAAHGAGPKAVQKLVDLGVNVLVTGNGPGGKAAAALATTGIKVFIGAGELTMHEAREAYERGALNQVEL